MSDEIEVEADVEESVKLDARTQGILDTQKNLNPGEEIVNCPTCGQERRAFTIINNLCDSCQININREAQPPYEFKIGWPEVRRRRDRFLKDTDWTQVADVPANIKTPHVQVRQSLRDITQYATPEEAWEALKELNSSQIK